MAIDSPIKTLTSRPTFLRSAAMLSGVLIALVSVSPGIAQTQSPKDDMERCNQLRAAYSKYSGRVNYSPPVEVDVALEDCRKGKFAAGIAGLAAALQRAGIPVPPAETAGQPNPDRRVGLINTAQMPPARTEQPQQASAPSNDAAYCATLSKVYRKTAPQHQDPSATVPTAMANCDAGNTAAGIPVLEQALRNGGMTVPQRTQ